MDIIFIGFFFNNKIRLRTIGIIRKIYLSTALSFVVGTCCAQSNVEDDEKLSTFEERISVESSFATSHIEQPALFRNTHTSEERKFFSNDIGTFRNQDSIQRIQSFNPSNSSEGKILNINNLGLYAASSEHSYINLLRNRSATLFLNYQNDNLSIRTGLIANQYQTRDMFTQFGVSGSIEYKLSPHWSVAIFGTLYNSNPYFSMATHPFVETTSYGGWIKYEGERMGVKLGARRYYDSFQRQWRFEPIITPTFKVGRKLHIELPVGPLVQETAEKLLRKNTNNGPIIMPRFN